MRSVLNEIVTGLKSGSFRSMLVEDTRRWRTHHSDYALSNVVRYAIEDDRADEVHAVLGDALFCRLRRSRFGPNGLRDDINQGLGYFSRRRPDLLRYMQLLFLQRSADGDDDTVRLHQRHCQAFADFLQLDVPPAERRELGLHRVLQQMFPMSLAADPEPGTPNGTDGPVVELRGYDLGSWACSCGARHGQVARYDFACGCGTLYGNGRLDEDTPVCGVCRTPVAYRTCMHCDTRVTLELLWRIRAGGVHPSVYRVPLTLRLTVHRPEDPVLECTVELLHLPVLLGVSERSDALVFDLPDILWVGSVTDWRGGERETGQLVAISDSPLYDRQTNVTKILEAAFRRALTARGQRAGSSLQGMLRRRYGNGRRSRHSANTTAWFTQRFATRISSALGAKDVQTADLARLVDTSRTCVVAASATLRGTMVLVNRSLALPGAFSSPHLVNLGISLRESALGPDLLTAEPPRLRAQLLASLAPDGIVVPGQTVEPGHVLVGISSPAREEELTQAERLLRAIFGEQPDNRKDKSLRWTGDRPAQVLAVYLNLGDYWAKDRDSILALPGRFTDNDGMLTVGETARVTITLAVEEPLETGDIVFDDNGRAGVVCAIHDGAELRALVESGVEPDLVVGPGHPWLDSAKEATIQARLRNDERLHQMVSARGTGPYSMITQRPLALTYQTAAQRLRASDFAWLYERGAAALVLELFAPRCDAVDWRVALYEMMLVNGSCSLRQLTADHTNTPSLADSPSEGPRNWDRLLRSACIRPELHRDRLRFIPLGDEEILAESSGEVRRAETLNPRTLLPEHDGLFCQRVFGPVESWRCACRKVRGQRNEGTVCDRCGVEVTHSRVRRSRIGHLELAAPVIHTWYVQADDGGLADLAGVDQTLLNHIVYGARYVVQDAGTSTFQTGQIVEYRDTLIAADSGAHVVTGAEGVEALVARRLGPSAGRAALRGIVLRRLPILPPDLRPMIQQANGRIASSPLTELYRDVIHHNSNVLRLTESQAPTLILDHQRRLLQKAIDALLDHRWSGDPEEQETRHRNVSLADATAIRMGATGSLRQRLLDRTTEYSAQTRLVTGATPDIDTALLPDRLAWHLFSPLVMKRLVDAGVCSNVKAARTLLQDRGHHAWTHLAAVCRQSTILIGAPAGPWPLIALHADLTGELALKVHPDLMDRIGWEHLGATVRIFAVLSTEAEQDANKRLLASELIRDDRPVASQTTPRSFLDIDYSHLPDAIVRLVTTRQAVELTDMDQLLLAQRWVPSGDQRPPNDT